MSRRVRPASLALLGLLALAGCGQSSPPAATPTPTFAAAGKVTCTEVGYAPQASNAAGREPEMNYYSPGTKAPLDAELEPLLASDGLMIVRYRRDAPGIVRAGLRDWVPTTAQTVVIPNTAREAAPVEAFIGVAHMTCDGFDAAQLTALAQRRAL